MSIRIENASKSLAYVSVEAAVPEKPTSAVDNLKASDVSLLIIATTIPQEPSPDDVIPCTALGPGDSLPVDADAETPAEFGFVEADPDLSYFGVEMEQEDDVTVYRLHAADSGAVMPSRAMH